MNGITQNSNGFVNAVWQAVEYHLQEYPKSTLKDLYKNFFQDAYGPGHLINDTVAVKKYLLEELNSYIQIKGRIADPTGYKHNFYRVNLSIIKNGLIPFDLYFHAFLKSAEKFKPVEIEEWIDEWKKIEILIRSMRLSLPNYEEDKKEIMEQLNEGIYAGHHSRIFNNAYEPHYRLMSSHVFHNIILPVISRYSVY